MVNALPFLGLSGLNAVAGLGAGPLVWAVFAAAYGLGAWGVFLVQSARVLGRDGRMVRLAGETLTLT